MADPTTPDAHLVLKDERIFRTEDFLTFDLVGNNQTYSNDDFRNVTGWNISPKDSNRIWFLSFDSCCVQEFDLQSYSFAVVAGKCMECGSRDGTFLNALIGEPKQLLSRKYSKAELVFFDNFATSLRCLCFIESKWKVVTLLQSDTPVNYITFDVAEHFLYATTRDNGLLRMKSSWREGIDIIMSPNDGHNDGKLNNAALQNPQHMFFLSNDMFFIADHGNNVLRLVDLKDNTISTVCVPRINTTEDIDGNADECKIAEPISFFMQDELSIAIFGSSSYYLLNLTGKIYMGHFT